MKRNAWLWAAGVTALLGGFLYMTIWNDDPTVGGDWSTDGDASTLQTTEILAIQSVRAELNYDLPIVIEDIDENPAKFDDKFAVPTNTRNNTSMTVKFAAPVSGNAIVRAGDALQFTMAVQRAGPSGGFDPQLNLSVLYNGGIIQTDLAYQLLTDGDGEYIEYSVPWSLLPAEGLFDPSLVELLISGTPVGTTVQKRTAAVGAAAMILHFEGNEAAWTNDSEVETPWDEESAPSTIWS